MSDFIQRLSEFMKAKSINDNQLTIAAGLSNGLIGKAKSNGKALSVSNIEKVLNAFPDLSAQWLMTGKGEMLKTKCTSQHISDISTPVVACKGTENLRYSQNNYGQNIPTRPRIPIDAAAGSLSIALESVSENDCEWLPVIPTLPDYDFTITARGDSMKPFIESGDELACRFIKESSFIQWGRTYVLDTVQGVVVKRVFNGHNAVICKSNNDNFPDFEIPKEDILHIALVVGLLRQF